VLFYIRPYQRCGASLRGTLALKQLIVTVFSFVVFEFFVGDDVGAALRLVFASEQELGKHVSYDLVGFVFEAGLAAAVKGTPVSRFKPLLQAFLAEAVFTGFALLGFSHNSEANAASEFFFEQMRVDYSILLKN